MTENAEGPFAPKHLNRRRFACGWGSRPESPKAIAERIQLLNTRIAEIEPAYGELWPLFAARAIRPGRDPGPVLAMTSEGLGEVIDRRARWDPPRWPAPVSSGGYSLIMAANRTGLDPLDIGLSVQAGRWGDWPNQVSLEFHPDAPLLANVELGLQVLTALIEAMTPDRAYAYGYLPHNDDSRAQRIPWLYWERSGELEPLLPWQDNYDWVERGGPPVQVRAERGGELKIWP